MVSALDPDVHRFIKGVITLGTPFITCSPRNLGPSIRALGWAIPFCLVILSVVVSVPTLLHFLSLHADYTLTLWVSIYLLGNAAIVVGLSVLGIKMRRWCTRGLPDWLLLKQRETQERLRTLQSDSDIDLLSLYVSGDEASIWLTNLERIGNILHIFYSFFLTLILVLFLFLECFSLMSFVVPSYELFFDTASQDIFLILYPSIFLYVLVAPMLGLWPWLIRGHRYGFGGETIVDNMLCKITVDTTPRHLGKASSIEVIPGRLAGGMRHSSFYNDVNVCAVITEWIKNGQPYQRHPVCARRPPRAIWSALVPYLVSSFLVAGVIAIRIPLYESAHHLESRSDRLASGFPRAKRPLGFYSLYT